MSRRRGRNVHGVILLDKPRGLSSNQALQKVRRLYDARKAGHTGSLDPLATGMLPICLGEASKTAGFMLDADKRYIASMRLGEATATGDAEGAVVEHSAVPELNHDQIETAFEAFLGDTEQVPPMYSALKVDGTPLYRLARKGKVVERKPRRVRIHSLELLDWSSPDIQFEVRCSKGTYVRTLAEDIARQLGSCAHLIDLRRTGVGVFDADSMVTLEDLESAGEDLEAYLLSVDSGLTAWKKIILGPDHAGRFKHGNPVPCDPEFAGMVRVYDESDCLLGLGQVAPEGRLKPTRVFSLD